MASVIQPPSTMATTILPNARFRNPKTLKPTNYKLARPQTHPRGTDLRFRHTVRCTTASPWEPPPVTYAPTDDKTEANFLTGPSTLFETLGSDKTAELQATDTKGITKIEYMRWPMWVLGPPLLLATGMVPTLWLPLSSVFMGPNVASLLSLTGLDCIFNLGASLFLLMADACSRPRTPAHEPCRSRAPFGYRFWNMVATISGLALPLLALFGSQKGVLQPQLPPISFAILLGPYLLLLAVQMLTEMLTWHWESPVWLVTPVVYEAYRVLQLMRGLRLGGELGAPAWTVHIIRGLVCWWVLVLGVQLMRVAWYAGFTARVQGTTASGTNDAETEATAG